MEPKDLFIRICKDVIKRDGIDQLLEWLEKTDWYTAPASSRFHGSYPGGLLEHSLNVYHELHRMLKAFPEVECSEETAAIISLFHDLCKVNFYTTEQRNRKNEDGKWESYTAYKIQEKFVYGGHGSKSVFLLQNFMKLKPVEAVAIMNHMGAFDNQNVGSVYEKYPLAFLLHVADGSASYIIESTERS